MWLIKEEGKTFCREDSKAVHPDSKFLPCLCVWAVTSMHENTIPKCKTPISLSPQKTGGWVIHLRHGWLKYSKYQNIMSVPTSYLFCCFSTWKKQVLMAYKLLMEVWVSCHILCEAIVILRFGLQGKISLGVSGENYFWCFRVLAFLNQVRNISRGKAVV